MTEEERVRIKNRLFAELYCEPNGPMIIHDEVIILTDEAALQRNAEHYGKMLSDDFWTRFPNLAKMLGKK